jgi:hypothetical protein
MAKVETITPGNNAPPLVTKEVTIQLGALQDHNIPLEGLTVGTLLSEHTLTTGETTADLTFADAPKGQVLFVYDPNGTAFVISYTSATDVQSGLTNITLDSIADGFIMLNPIMLGFSEQDRLTLLQYAKTTLQYQDLKDAISNALQVEPTNLLNEAVFPEIYRDALSLTIDAYKHLSENAVQKGLLSAPLAASPITVGENNLPHLTDVVGPDILAVNPSMLFYGITINGQSPHVLLPKESWLTLNAGWQWPPVTWDYTPPTIETITLGDGIFTVDFAKYGISDTASTMAAAANMLRESCFILDAVFWCPVSSSTIASYVDNNGLSLATLASLADDIVGVDSEIGIVQVVLDYMTKPEGWRNITRAVYSNAEDKAAAIKFLQGSKKVLTAASVVSKLLTVYDAANVWVPYLWDWYTKPKDIQLCITQSNGIMTGACQHIPPIAIIAKVSPDNVYVGDRVLFDASGSYDDLDPMISLKVRWDFGGDHNFDTDWSTLKDASWSYSHVGSYDVVLEVEDSEGLVGHAVFTVVVHAANAGGSATHIKAFRDVLPWDTLAFEQTMAANGFTQGAGQYQYEILPSSALATEILTPGYDLVVVMNDQDQAFYNNLAAALPRVERFINNGGVVLWEASDLGWHNGSMAAAGINQLPGGVQYQHLYDPTNDQGRSPGSAGVAVDV